MKEPIVSVVIPYFNGYSYLEKLLPCFQSQTLEDYELIIVNDDPKDSKVESLLKKFPKLVQVKNNENLGFAKSVNRGIKRTRGKYVCLLNQDTIVDKNYLKKHVDFLEEIPSTAVLGCKFLNKSGGIYFSNGVLHTGFPFDTYEDLKEVKETEHVCLGSAFIRKKVFREIGLVSEDYFAKYEDCDFSERIRRETNYKLQVLPHALVTHTGISTAMSNYNNLFHSQRSLIIFQRKFYPKALLKNIFFHTPKLIFLDYLYMIPRNPISYLQSVHAVLSGTASALRWRPKK
ncbi:MAG: glycosyltransferase family 2 protein [Candidatus Diapherotrites archaeon]|uniref:Glycosyltransferase family 2 protein n=1 Tax=Candidatus Iainarchaeum sp. TaxID=3101447 RepID=A0A8T4KXZ0_9ARCH|nr:glycosyltransferase family 2 protein [Candidatus Diapherotrites archaeon]